MVSRTGSAPASGEERRTTEIVRRFGRAVLCFVSQPGREPVPNRDYCVAVDGREVACQPHDVSRGARRLGRRLVGVLGASVALSCAEPPDPDFEIPAEFYVESFCEQRCEIAEECKGADFEGEQACWTECESLADEEMGDPSPTCFERMVEFNRCRFERLSCEEFIREPGESLEEPEDSPCRDAYEVWKACD